MDFQSKTKAKKASAQQTSRKDRAFRPDKILPKEASAKPGLLIRIPPFSALFWFFLLLMGEKRILLPSFAAALIHEAGHLAAIRLCGASAVQITLYPFGADIRRTGRITSYSADFLISGAGIAANMLASAACLPFRNHEGISAFFICSLSLAAVNLLPVSLLDGGGMLTALLCRFCGAEKAGHTVSGISFFTVVLLWIFSLYILFYTSSNFSLFLLSAYLFSSLFLHPSGADTFS